jgi:hypothetical protein
MHFPSFFWALLALVHIAEVHASVTVYSQVPYNEFTKTASAALATYTAHAMYDPTNLNPPPLPVPPPATQFSLTLQATSAQQGGLSQAVSGTFWGISVEMSVANQVFGKNSSILQVPFLNLMSLLKARGGGVHIRVGGNTQETATMITDGTSLPNGTILAKGPPNAATGTPSLLVSPDFLYMLNNISFLLGDTIKWFIGVPMNDTNNPRLQIAEYAEEILGDNLLGLQVGNEPDLYGGDGLGGRTAAYTPQNYVTEFGQMMTAINNDPKISVKNKIVGPSVGPGSKNWTTFEIFSLGYLQSFASNLGFISVEKYFDNNCAAAFPNSTAKNGPIINPQDEIANYTTHAAGLEIVAEFANASISAQQAKLPLLMFETNSASCGGFPGISNTYASALWGLDYGLTMAAAGFSGAHLHVSGSTVYYNPFTPPPTNQSSFRQWTISPIFYTNLVMAEILGPTNTAQVVDLQANSGSNSTPAFGIYENGKPARVALFNFLTDPSGASTYTASIGISSSVSQVTVKYLTADSVTQKTNISWAGQNFGGVFQSDGRLQGDLSIQTVPCSNNICQIKVPAPGFALVSFIDTAFTQTSSVAPIATYSTTTTTGFQREAPSVTVDPSVLATSNGHNANDLLEGGRTSQQVPLSETSGLSTKTIAIISGSVGGGVLLMVLGCVWCCCRRRVGGKYAKLDDAAPMAATEVHAYVPYNQTRYETAWDELQNDNTFRSSSATARSSTAYDASRSSTARAGSSTARGGSSTAYDANRVSTASWAPNFRASTSHN